MFALSVFEGKYCVLVDGPVTPEALLGGGGEALSRLSQVYFTLEALCIKRRALCSSSFMAFQYHSCLNE